MSTLRTLRRGSKYGHQWKHHLVPQSQSQSQTVTPWRRFMTVLLTACSWAGRKVRR